MDAFGRRALLLGLLGVAGSATACSRSSSTAAASASPTTSAPPSPLSTPSPTPTPEPRWPLTGRPLHKPARAAHAAVAVKVPDNIREHPQVGIDSADIVFVELDGYRDSSGYSGTRLMPVFHTTLPDDVAPVRSIRPVDVPLLSPMTALIGNTGATGWVLEYVKEYRASVESMLSYMGTKGTGSYSIDPSRVRTYQGATYYDRAVVCHPQVLVRQTKKFRTGPQQSYFPFATTSADVSTVSGAAARTVRVPWKQGHTYDMSYRYDEKSGRYLRSMPWGKHVLADGTRVAPDNVLVIQARQRYAKLHSGRGGVEPVHDIIKDKGSFLYAHGGRAVTGTWTKGAEDETFSFTLDDGSPLLMAPGKTFVELARPKAAVSIAG